MIFTRTIGIVGRVDWDILKVCPGPRSGQIFKTEFTNNQHKLIIQNFGVESVNSEVNG